MFLLCPLIFSKYHRIKNVNVIINIVISEIKKYIIVRYLMDDCNDFIWPFRIKNTVG